MRKLAAIMFTDLSFTNMIIGPEYIFEGMLDVS